MSTPIKRVRTTTNYRMEPMYRIYHTDNRLEFSIPVSTYYSQITDYINTRNSVGFKGDYPITPVEHLTYKATDGFISDFVGVLGYMNILYSRNRIPLSPEWVDFLVPPVPEEILHEFAAEAFDSFDTQIVEKVQSLDFLGSIGDIGDLIPKITGDLASDAAGAYLGDEFGWKNLEQDVQNLTHLISDVQARLQELRNTYGKTVRLGYARSAGWSPMANLPLDRNEVYFHPEAGYGWRCELLEYECLLRAGGYRFHLLKDLDRTLSVIRGCFVALGLGNPIKAIWDAIPLSFIVGWLTNVGGLLSSRNIHHLFEGEWSIHHLSTSQTIKAKLRVRQHNLNEGSPVPWLGMPLEQSFDPILVDAKRYVRYSGLPLEREFRLRLKAPNPKQLSLLVALATTFGTPT